MTSIDGRQESTDDMAAPRGTRDNIDLVNEVRKIFVAKNWPIDESETSGIEGPFERTMRMLTQLNEEEINLILKLLGRFVRIELDQYTSAMSKIVSSIVDDISPVRVVIVPIKSSKDSRDRRSKSGDLMGIIARTAFSGLSIRVDAFSDLDAGPIQTMMGKPGSYVLGVDDFIGTGRTAVSFIDDYLARFPGRLSQLRLASLVSLERGASAIGDRGCGLYCVHKMGRAISDCSIWSLSAKSKYLSAMAEIESRIGISHEYHLGYGKSEGLVKMLRTPNNTFPIFWATKIYNGAPWPATFPR
ncbi:MAG TPA: hypothetical protein VNL35_00640 [Chloroflexota bacterium]|nr:hypothetical protein [Chloroflexota bacterium]